MSWEYYDEDYEARRQATLRKLRRQMDAGEDLRPVVPTAGLKLSSTFWGQAWNKNLISYSDYESRLPRGRSYFRQGRVYNLEIIPGRATALVAGQRLYEVQIRFAPLDEAAWEELKRRCAGQAESVMDLLAGELGPEVMKIMTDPDIGLFPSPREIKFSCTCPDDASLCKHVAATLYGIGARLDERPQALFQLRHRDPAELIAHTQAVEPAAPPPAALEGVDLGQLFGIELEQDDPPHS